MFAEHPDLEPFVVPEQPSNTPPNLAINAGNQAVQLAVADNEAQKPDWVILRGFMKGMSENIRDALDLEYYEDLEHVDHGYRNVKPINYVNHLETEHCPCDEQAAKDCREHFFRGWQQSSGSSGTKTENLCNQVCQETGRRASFAQTRWNCHCQRREKISTICCSATKVVSSCTLPCESGSRNQSPIKRMPMPRPSSKQRRRA